MILQNTENSVDGQSFLFMYGNPMNGFNISKETFTSFRIQTLYYTICTGLQTINFQMILPGWGGGVNLSPQNSLTRLIDQSRSTYCLIPQNLTCVLTFLFLCIFLSFFIIIFTSYYKL